MPVFRLPDASAYLVAFSGGADSRLLLELSLRALLEREGEGGRQRLLAAHLHHGIRGSEADRDQAFCRQVCCELGIELISERADIPAIAAETGESQEAAARRIRYDFLTRVMARRGIPLLMTAHHADDNLETVLERLLRGSGTRGMGGIPTARELVSSDGFTCTVYRPLLDWTRRDILAACEEWGLRYVTDSTNLQEEYTRNRIRHSVVPVLEEIAGEGIPQRVAARLSRNAREDEACLTELAEVQVNRHRSPTGDGLPRDELQAQHPALSKRMMSILYRRATVGRDLGDGSDTLSASHLDALLELVRRGIPESAVTLPRGMEARLRGEWLCIRRTEEFTADGVIAPVTVGVGRTPFGLGVMLEVEESPTVLSPKKGSEVFASAVFPPDLPLPLVARVREAGDVIVSHGMTKKIKKLLCDKDIPLHLRHRIPLLCLEDGEPLWYPGAAFRDGYPPPAEGPCLRITVYCTSL